MELIRHSFFRLPGFLILVGFLNIQTVHAQKLNLRQRLHLKDSLDQKLDLSEYIINLHGLVPIPMLISEPALGNIGVALGLVYISPKKSAGKEQGFRFPDITAVGGLYTANGTWGLGAFRQGSFPKIGMRYQAIGLYVDVNLNFYRALPNEKEEEFLMNMVAPGIILDASKNVYHNKAFIGLRYQFFNSKIKGVDGILPEEVFDSDEFDQRLATLGLYGEWDGRNNLFTPDRGLRFKATYHFSREWLGSDFNTGRFETYATWFLQPTDRWVSGFKAKWQVAADDAPFYYLPFIMMRGIPVMRYQGKQVLLVETEQRFDINTRWSVVGFVGSGKPYTEDLKFLAESQWYWAGGAGFRYLLARAFNARVGIDIAAGPDQFAYYLIFGHYWNR